MIVFLPAMKETAANVTGREQRVHFFGGTISMRNVMS